MKLTPKSYVPVLKWKRAEQGALVDIGSDLKDRMLPLIELVMPKPKSSLKDMDIEGLYSEVLDIFQTKKLQEIPKEIMEAWGLRPIFVDFSLLYPEVKLLALKYVTSEAAKMSLNIVPVVNFGDSNEFKVEVVKCHRDFGSDICVRVTSSDLGDMASLNSRLKNYLDRSGATEKDTYLVVDLKDLDEVGDYSDYSRSVDVSQNIMNIHDWKGLVLASGSFPLDLSDCKIDEDNFIARNDWNYWRKQFDRKSLKRMPTFADYGIRHPIYVESYQFREPTASVKYTLKDSWWVVKGKKRKFEYFLGAAALLKASESYYGKTFSAGDKYIADKAAHYPEYLKDPKIKGTGTTESWLKAGLNHHLSVVSDQLSNLA